jgi:hypothetical protein
MSEKINGNKIKASPKPYDHRISETCEKCTGTMVFRKSSFFGKKIYYKVCNNCGSYILIDRESWKELVAIAMAPRPKEESIATQDSQETSGDDLEDLEFDQETSKEKVSKAQPETKHKVTRRRKKPESESEVTSN